MAIEASLRDLQRDESKQEDGSHVEEEEDEEDEEEEEEEEEKEGEDQIEMEEAVGTSDEQIGCAGEYKSDKGSRVRRKVKDTDEVMEVQQEKKETPRTVKEKKEVMRMEKEKERRKRAEMALMKGCNSPSLEGLTEMDIKRKLIESAKIKSKVARQGNSETGDKIRRKSKKQENNNGSSGSEEKEKKRKSSSDVYEDPSLSSKKRRSSVSGERVSDVKSSPKCDIGGQVRGVEGGGRSRSKEGNFERSTAGEEAGKTESTKSGE